jgi:hypothetical protein
LRRVRGVKDESDALVRLADAVCGLMSAAVEGQPTMAALFERGIETGWLRDVSTEHPPPGAAERSHGMEPNFVPWQ